MKKTKGLRIHPNLLKRLIECSDWKEFLELKDELIGLKKSLRPKKKEVLLEKIYKTPEQYREELILNQTPAEKSFKCYLKAADINYEFQKIVYAEDKYYILDFFLPDSKLAVEIDGGYHDTVEQKRNDLDRTKRLKRNHVVKDILRLKNNEVNATCIDRVILFIKDSKIIEKRSIEEQRKKYK